MIGHHFVDLVKRTQHVRGLLVPRHDLLAEIGEALAGQRVGKRGHHGGVELGDNVLRRALGRPQRMLDGKVEARQPRLVNGGISGAAARRSLAMMA
jgi:hypothetical protein